MLIRLVRQLLSVVGVHGLCCRRNQINDHLPLRSKQHSLQLSLLCLLSYLLKRSRWIHTWFLDDSHLLILWEREGLKKHLRRNQWSHSTGKNRSRDLECWEVGCTHLRHHLRHLLALRVRVVTVKKCTRYFSLLFVWTDCHYYLHWISFLISLPAMSSLNSAIEKARQKQERNRLSTINTVFVGYHYIFQI